MGVHQLPRPVRRSRQSRAADKMSRDAWPPAHTTRRANAGTHSPQHLRQCGRPGRWQSDGPQQCHSSSPRSTPFDDSGSSRQAASPTMNQAGCAGCAAMRQVTSAPLDCPIGVSLRKLTGTQLGGGREPSAVTRVHPLPTSRAARRPVRSACRVTEHFASFTCWQTVAQLPRRTYARFDVPLS